MTTFRWWQAMEILKTAWRGYCARTYRRRLQRRHVWWQSMHLRYALRGTPRMTTHLATHTRRDEPLHTATPFAGYTLHTRSLPTFAAPFYTHTLRAFLFTRTPAFPYTALPHTLPCRTCPHLPTLSNARTSLPPYNAHFHTPLPAARGA